MTLGAVSFSALGRPSTLAGGIPYADGTEYALLPAGTSGQVLQSNGAAAPSWGPGSAVQTTNTDTGTKNDWAPGMNGGLTIQPWSGAADIAVTGLSGLATGAVWIFKNIGTKNAYFTHLGGGSTAAHQFTNRITSGNGTPVAPGGCIGYYNDGTSLKLLLHNQGAAINVAFSAGNFTGTGLMTWSVDSGDVQGFSYEIVDNIITVFVGLNTTTVGGTVNTQLLVTIPNGFQAGATCVNAGGRIADNGTEGVGLVFVASGGTAVVVEKYPSLANFTLSTNNTVVQLTIAFPLA